MSAQNWMHGSIALVAVGVAVTGGVAISEASPAMNAIFEGTTLQPSVSGPQCDAPSSQKVDCGHLGSTEPTCEAAGCCWVPVTPNPNNDPWCYYAPGNAPQCPLTYNSSGAPFAQSEVDTMRKYFLANINIDGSGAVVAAPDYNTPGGSYYFHWERDGALSMAALLETASSVDDVRTQFDAYVQWVSKVQNENDPHGQSVLAEPKYMIPNASVFAGGWCRPQNDGPGLRSTALMNYATALAATNSIQDVEYVASTLWPLIKTDLDWQSANWNANGCDLWEEIRSDDFFWNRFTMRAALTRGSAFAQLQNDKARSQSYAAAAKAVEATLANHFSGDFVFEATNRKKDASVICAFNVGYIGDGVFAPTSAEVAATVKTLNDLFCSTFQINQKDTAAGIPGILYGRYEGDNYAGGNPWILLSSALAELLYRGASDVLASNRAMDLSTYQIWAPIIGLPDISAANELDVVTVAAAFAGAGDGVLTRVRTHVKDAGFHLSEQIDRNTGTPMAAHDLTWSYAATLKAVHARSTYSAALEEFLKA